MSRRSPARVPSDRIRRDGDGCGDRRRLHIIHDICYPVVSDGIDVIRGIEPDWNTIRAVIPHADDHGFVPLAVVDVFDALADLML